MFKQQMKMSKEDVHVVKTLICEGYSQVAVARAVGISASHVSRICAGDVHRDVDWPNPEIGEKLMRERREVISYMPLGGGQPSLILPPVPSDNTMQVPAEEIRKTHQASEQEAIKQAQEKTIKREEMRKEIFRRSELVEKEMDADFLQSMQHSGEPDQTEVKKMPSAWEVDFIPWQDLVEQAGEIEVVQALVEEGDEIARRAIGIVFYSLDKDKWGEDQTLGFIVSVRERLEEAN